MVAAEAGRVENADVAPRPPSNIIAAVFAGFTLFILAIIARNFWLSLVFGIAGGIALTCAMLLLSEYRKSLSDDDKGAP